MPDSLPTLDAERLTLRPLGDEDIEPLLAIIHEPSVHEWWGDTDEEEIRNDGLAFVIDVDGEIAGWLGFYEETDEQYKHAGIDISLKPSHQDRGLGSEAIRTVIDWLRAERGHHRFVIDPAAANDRAIAAYEKVGFKPVGRMRKYERGPDGEWRDGLLMDLLADELDTPR